MWCDILETNNALYIFFLALAGVVTVVAGVMQFLEYRKREKARGPEESAQDLRNRQNMLKLVENTWIEGLLEKSLYNEVLIEPGLETRPDAVERPWDMTVQMLDNKPEPLPHGIKMSDVFDRMRGSMLILGEPGSGKTTMLLELTRQLIERTDLTSVPLVPVAFNLSSWTPALPFHAWLVKELRSKYYVPEKIAAPWVDGDRLVLLLDGLDEVKAENREACVGAINEFRLQHAVPLAVCSRRQEYEALAEQCKLRVQGAVMIQAMDDKQVAEYLRKAGAGLNAVHRLLKRDPALQEFARTPLILSILVLTYRNAEEKTLKSLEAEADYRKRLFDDYIEQMFNHRPASRQFAPEQTKHWLHWLAGMMTVQGQSLFYIEDVTFRVLEISRKKLRLIFGLSAGLVFGLSAGLIFGLIGGLIFGLISGLSVGLSFGLSVGLTVGLIGGLVAGLSFGLMGGLDTEPTERVRWSWRGGRNGLIVGLIFGLIFGLSGGLIFGLSFGLIGGLSGSANNRRNRAGEGVRASVKNWLIVGLIVGVSVGLIFGLSFGLMGGLSMGLFYGGNFIIQHYISRILLYRSNHLPWKLIPFLDHCTDLIFLRRVGGGYIFIHRMLMEHFAEMDEKGTHRHTRGFNRQDAGLEQAQCD